MTDTASTPASTPTDPIDRSALPVEGTPIVGFLRTIRILCFAVVSFFWTAFSFFIGCIALLFTPFSGKLGTFIARLWGQVFIRSLGIEIDVEGRDRLDPSTPRMFVANHASWFDPPAIFLTVPAHVRFVLKHELIKLPFIGWYTALAGHFLLDRSSPREGQRIVDRAIKRIHKYGLSPAVFPEGTRTRDGTLGPFRAGAFAIAMRAGIDIQPIFIDGTYEIWPKHRNIPERAGAMRVIIGEPISTEGFEGSRGRKEISALVRASLIELGAKEAPAKVS